MGSSRHPPYQLIPGEKYNLTLGIITAFGLAAAKDGLPSRVHPFVRWSVNAFTNWNLAFVALRVLLQQEQWDPFLLVNSMSVCMAFRTGFSQGLDENMRKKIASMDFEMPRPLFVCADHLCHTLPVVVLATSILRQRRRVHPMNGVYGLLLFTWFAYRQSGQLDASKLYMPHPWKRTWLAAIAALGLTPPMVEAILDRSRGRAALYAIGLLLPYLSTRLDPNLRRTYMFEAALARASEAARCKQPPELPRVQSETPLRWQSEHTE